MGFLKRGPFLDKFEYEKYFKLGEINKSIDLWQKAKELNSENKILLKKIEDKKYYDPVF